MLPCLRGGFHDGKPYEITGISGFWRVGLRGVGQARIAVGIDPEDIELIRVEEQCSISQMNISHFAGIVTGSMGYPQRLIIVTNPATIMINMGNATRPPPTLFVRMPTPTPKMTLRIVNPNH